MTVEMPDELARHSMTQAGIPHPLAWSESKGTYLKQWVIARKEGRTIPVAAAAHAAAVDAATVRTWRARDPEFKAAERSVRFGEPYREPEHEPELGPEPRTGTVSRTDELREAYDRTKALLQSIGRPPFFEGTRLDRQGQEYAYAQARERLTELTAEMRSRGIPAEPVPPDPPTPAVRFIRNDNAPDWARPQEAR